MVGGVHNNANDTNEVNNREDKSNLKRLAETTREPLRSLHDTVNRQMGGIDITFAQSERAMRKRRSVLKRTPTSAAEYKEAPYIRRVPRPSRELKQLGVDFCW